MLTHLEINALPQSMFGSRGYIRSGAKGRGHKVESFLQTQGW